MGYAQQFQELKSNNLFVFDLDKTLINGDSEEMFLDYLDTQIDICGDIYIERAKYLQAYRLEGGFVKEIVATSALPLKGLAKPYIEFLARSAFFKFGLKALKPKVPSFLSEIKSMGGDMLLVSASISPIVECFSRYLGFDEFAGTDIDYVNNIATGGILGTPFHGANKIEAINRVKNSSGKKIWFFGDSFNDIRAMEASHVAVAIDPNSEFREYCLSRDIKIINLS